jgi:hypothetical protein
MPSWKCFGAMIVIVSVLSAQQAVVDPVLSIQSQRPSSGDLPPVPRGIVEPPPLPAPETHVKDTRGYRASRRTRRKVVKKVKKRPVAAAIKQLPRKKP